MYKCFAACVVVLLCCLASAQTATLRELSDFEGYREAHWFADGEHLLLVRWAAEARDHVFTITDRIGSLNTRTRSRKNLQFYATNRVYLIGGDTLYSVGTDGLYATRPLPETYRAYTHVSPDGRWLFSVEGVLLNENFQEIVNVFETVGYDLADGAISGTYWNGGRLYLVTGGPVNGQVYSHVLEIELSTGTLTVLDESPTADWVELEDGYPNGDLLIRRRNETTGEHFYQRCTTALACTTLTDLAGGGRLIDISLSKDGLYYGGQGFEPNYDNYESGRPPAAVVGHPDGSWVNYLPVVTDFWYQWSPTRHEMVITVVNSQGDVLPLVVEIQ